MPLSTSPYSSVSSFLFVLPSVSGLDAMPGCPAGGAIDPDADPNYPNVYNDYYDEDAEYSHGDTDDEVDYGGWDVDFNLESDSEDDAADL